MKTNRAFGIEIEAYNVNHAALAAELNAAGITTQDQFHHYNHRTPTIWKVMSDASLYGRNAFELVSPILSGKDGLNQVRKVCEVLNRLGAKVNRECGLHVHVDARNATARQLSNVLRHWAKYEANIMEMMPASRHNNHYCKTVFDDNMSIEQRFERIARAEQRGALSGQGARDVASEFSAHGCDRYRTLNLCSFLRQGSVEFRVHNGTTDSTKITEWVKLVTGLVTTAFEFSQERGVAKTYANEFRMLEYFTDAKGARYIHARRAAIAAAAGQRLSVQRNAA